jgi:hypothetical protein
VLGFASGDQVPAEKLLRLFRRIIYKEAKMKRLIITILALGCTAAVRAAATETLHPEFKTGEIASIKIETDDANSDIKGADKDFAITINNFDKDKCIFKSENLGKELVLTLKPVIDTEKHGFLFFYKWINNKNRDCRASLSVVLPPVMPISAHSENGSISIANSRADIDIVNSNGKISINGTNADIIKLHNNNGSITVSGSEGGMDVKNSNGSITASGISGKAKLHNDNGGIIVSDSKAAVNVTNSNGTVQLISTTGGAVVRNDNGSVVLDGASGGLDISDSNGGIRGSLSGLAKARDDNGSINLSWTSAPEIGDMTFSNSNGKINLNFPSGTALSTNSTTSNGSNHNSCPHGDRLNLTLTDSNGSINISCN